MRLNLGSGGRADEGWTHVDREFTVDQRAPTHVRLDIARDPWPWPDGSVEGIVMHHVADLLTADELCAVLLQCHRVLAPGGVLRVSCADVTRGIERAMAGDWSWCAERKFTEHGNFDPESTLGHFILQGGARNQFLTQKFVLDLMRDIQFAGAMRTSFQRSHLHPYSQVWITELDSRPDESWFVEAVK